MHKLYANAVLEKHWNGKLPVDVADIANKMGIWLAPDETLGDEKHSGCVERIDKDTFKITYNPEEPLSHKRFAVAHEIGHISLGHMNDLLTDGKKYMDTSDHFNINVKDPVERQANQFAMELLIPEEVIKFLFNKKFIYDFTKLAEIFSVSSNAIMYRMMDLGLIKK